MIKGSNAENNGAWATLIGVGTLLLTASGAFGEIQSSLNKIWKAEPKAGLSRLVRARIAGLGLVLTLAFLMIASLVVSAGLAALSNYLNSVFPAVHVVMAVANFVISVGLLAVLFAAIYKLLPDKPIEWRDVAVGAVATAILFTIGKSLIGLYIGHSKIASGYGAAGALVVMLVWIYYSAEIFLFGAEFTRAYAQLHGSHAKQAKPETAMQAGAGEAGSAEPVREAEPKPAASEAELSPERLELRAGMARHEMSDTWQVIRARMPRSPALGPADAPDPVDERPSWFQIAVAVVAFAALPKIRPRREPRLPVVRETPLPPIVHRRIAEPVMTPAETRRAPTVIVVPPSALT